MRYYIFGDVETTGLSEQTERMTEIALVKCDENFNIIDKFQMLINPERTVSAKITELTGITEAMVENEPKYDEALPIIKEWWIKDIDFGIINEEGDQEDVEIIFVAHNSPFDTKFINKGAQDILGKDLIIDWIDTVSLARELYPFWRNHKLETCVKKFGAVNERHHRAMADTMALYHIGKRLITEAYESNLNPINFRTTKKLHYGK
jgi:DNA polymerase-3 subunit alpha (Gram-positive type)